jgi:thiol-disulfide isomerase/thioredoxin
MRFGRRIGCVLGLTVALAAAGTTVMAAQPVKKLIAVTPAAAAAPFELRDLAGKLHRLADYRGKVVLMNFWATWCEPCRDEMPAMQTLYDRLGPRTGGDLVVLAVNYAENGARIRQYLKEYPFDFPVLLDGFSEVWRAWKPGMLPASYLIGRDGRVRYRVIGEFDWAGEEAGGIVRRLLAEQRG